MPRKQRFKPSRKPQSNPGTVPTPQVDDRKDINPEAQDIDRDAPARNEMRDLDDERD